ncbi:uncharacterized protein CIMG_04616 [Coccidioides immitis RS]|uniref:Uncharacterized protein n=1 Tax=Coccidioides immitis (strain RS) TaxID=246410 RepID=J3KDV3_COCIM|nr:uncharacterized protein CIMG_04616 [Coccidioides immitis RS]EAS33592.3 hypothetical protein CIMG_04616 [Coccidioides immitis RS]TPX21270.1 hypothetical protein DIZ76_015226 [Coccidioides immitis]
MDDFDFRRIPLRRTVSILINGGCDGCTSGGHGGRLRFSANTGGHIRRLRLQSNSTPAHGLDSDKRRLRRTYERRSQRTTSILGERRARQTDERSRLLANSGGHDGRPRF